LFTGACLPNDRTLLHGQVVTVHGRHYSVELDEGGTLTCFPRGKRSGLACGDRVAVLRTASDQGVVEAVDPRRTLLYRSDRHRQKLIAANATQMVVVLASVPSFYEQLLNRCLAAAEHERMTALIVLNKIDLLDKQSKALEALGLYRDLGYEVLPLVAKVDVEPLRGRLQGHLSVLVGQSGMGKSTIVNGLIPGACVKTGDVSFALDSGRHTTTYSRLHRLDRSSSLIDSPGLQEFGLFHLRVPELAHAFIEFRQHTNNCRFSDCRHAGEPDCAVEQAVTRGEITARRFVAYRQIITELEHR
jgi:ribosome biogenesis GTPase